MSPWRPALLLFVANLSTGPLAACAGEPPAKSPWFEPPAPEGGRPLYVIELLSDPRTFPILEKHIPEYLALLEQQVTPAPPSDFTLDDFRLTTGTKVTEEDIAAIKAEVARLTPR